MGIYINPPELSRLKAAGAYETTPWEFEHNSPRESGLFGIAFIDHYGQHYAAGIAWSPREARRFIDGQAGRKVVWLFMTLSQIESIDKGAADYIRKFFV